MTDTGEKMDRGRTADEMVAVLGDYEVGYRPHVVGKVLAEAAVTITSLQARVAELEAIIAYFNCIDFDRFTEHDEQLLEDAKRDAARVVPNPQ